MTKRTTGQWQELLDDAEHGPWDFAADYGQVASKYALIAQEVDDHNAPLIAAAPEAFAEVVRLRRALEEFLGEMNDDLAHEGVEDYRDIDDAWPSMQEYGELAVKLAHRNILTRILEGGTDE